MHVLLTGGAGYIGSHTALALKRAGYTPVVLDNLEKGHAWAVKFGPFLRGDVADTEILRKACADYAPVALLHFAAYTEVAESVSNPLKYLDNNYRKAALLFETALACGVKRIVFSSTAAVYGTPDHEAPLREDHPLRPINPYGESKLAAENHMRGLEGAGVRSVALRYFNAAGAVPEAGLGEAHKPETHLVPNALLAGLGRKEKIRVFGTDYPTPDGTAIRDYVHVMDLAAAHVAALKFLMEDGATDVFNLGTGVGTSVHEVLVAIGKELGATVPHTLEARRPGDPPRLVADASRACEKLGWKPAATLEDIVRSALAWHRDPTYEWAMEAGSSGTPA